MKYKNSKINPLIKVINDDEEFIDIDDRILPGVYPYYLVSNYGRVYHKFTHSFLKPGWCTSGYLFVYLSTSNGPKNFLLHRLVMIAFKPVIGYENLQVNHINGDKHCNYIWNLEWCTRKENILHAINTGLVKRKRSVSEDDVVNICKLLSSNLYTIDEISNITNISSCIISSIKKRKSYTDISKDYSFESRKGKLFSEYDIKLLCSTFQEIPRLDDECVNEYCKRILILLQMDYSDNMIDSVRKIYNRKYYTKISKEYNY